MQKPGSGAALRWKDPDSDRSKYWFCHEFGNQQFGIWSRNTLVIAWGSGFVRVRNIFAWSGNSLFYAILYLTMVKFVSGRIFTWQSFILGSGTGIIKKIGSKFASIYADFKDVLLPGARESWNLEWTTESTYLKSITRKTAINIIF